MHKFSSNVYSDIYSFKFFFCCVFLTFIISFLLHFKTPGSPPPVRSYTGKKFVWTLISVAYTVTFIVIWNYSIIIIKPNLSFLMMLLTFNKH